MVDLPHAKRAGWLKNGNPVGDLALSPRCGARTRLGIPCKGPAMKNGRCRMHGGKSTGPKTVEGIERAKMANWKHGNYSIESKALRRNISLFIRESGAFLSDLK